MTEHGFGRNDVYWSLANEAYYYALYPVLLWSIVRFGSRSLVYTSSFLILLLTALMPGMHSIPAYYPQWLIGVIIIKNLRAGIRCTRWTLAGACTLLAVGMAARIFEVRLHWPLQTLFQLIGGFGAAGDLFLSSTRVRNPKYYDTNAHLYGFDVLLTLRDSFSYRQSGAKLFLNPDKSIFRGCLVSLLAIAVSILVTQMIDFYVELPLSKKMPTRVL